MGCAAIPAFAGDGKITPSITVQETITDNVESNGGKKQSDWVTDISPGISIAGSGGRAKLNLSYQLHQLLYARDSARNETQHSLNALGTLEAIENWFFIDATGRISQEDISPFGGSRSGSSNVYDNANTTQTSSFGISPYFRGRLGGFGDYLLRYDMQTTRSDTSYSSDSETRRLLLNLRGTTALAQLGWAIDGVSEDVQYDDDPRSGYGGNRDYASDSVRGTLSWQFSPQFRASLIGGREANDYLTRDKESYSIKGAGLDWSPTVRTRLSATWEDRYFGNSHRIDFSHRTPRTVWRYTDSKDATADPNQQTSYGLGTNYDLFFSLFTSAIPDPTARAAYVNALLLAAGINPNTQLQGGYLTSGVSVQYRRQLSLAITGVRNTVTFAATRSENERLSGGVGTGLLIGNDFAIYDDVRQTGMSVNWSHKLTPNSTLVGMVSHLRSKGTGTNRVDTQERRFDLNFVTKLGPSTSGSIGVRRLVFDGDAGYGDYTENALIATISHRF